MTRVRGNPYMMYKIMGEGVVKNVFTDGVTVNVEIRGR